MHFALLTLAAVIGVNFAQAQYYYGGYPEYPFQYQYFRGGYPQSSLDDTPNPGNYFRSGLTKPAVNEKADARLWFSTLTVTIATTTSTITQTTSTTCTTSTAAISICSPSGRRRRGVIIPGNSKGRGLFYNEAEQEKEDGSIFVSEPKNEPTVEVEKERDTRQAESTPVQVPFMVQPGFKAPSEVGSGRFLMAFGTSTTYITTTSTYSVTLTATCKSTTGLLTCGALGK